MATLRCSNSNKESRETIRNYMMHVSLRNELIPFNHRALFIHTYLTLPSDQDFLSSFAANTGGSDTYPGNGRIEM